MQSLERVEEIRGFTLEYYLDPDLIREVLSAGSVNIDHITEYVDLEVSDSDVYLLLCMSRQLLNAVILSSLEDKLKHPIMDVVFEINRMIATVS